MDRLEQIKNEIVQEDGIYQDWESYMDDQPHGASDYMVNEVARRYAPEVARHNLERAAEKAKAIQYQHDHGSAVDKESIINTEIELI